MYLFINSHTFFIQFRDIFQFDDTRKRGYKRENNSSQKVCFTEIKLNSTNNDKNVTYSDYCIYYDENISKDTANIDKTFL